MYLDNFPAFFSSIYHELSGYVSYISLKTVAFIAGKKNPAVQKFFIHFSIENFIANISLYALSWPKLNFGCYLTFEIIF